MKKFLLLFFQILASFHGVHPFLADEYATNFRQMGKSHFELTECALNKVGLFLLTDDNQALAMDCGEAVDKRIEYCQIDGKVCAGFDRAVIEFARENAILANIAEHDTTLHFHGELFKAANERIFIEKQLAISAIEANLDYETARIHYAKAMHTIQDFYSNTNYIENGNDIVLQALGREMDYFQNNSAEFGVDTCTSCARIEDDFFEYLGESIFVDNNGCYYNWVLGVGDCNPVYRCDNQNLLVNENKLTSGYFGDETKPKDVRKCSHGGYDSGAILDPTGGINKDTNYIVYSPHYQLHDKAAKLAEDATVDLLYELYILLGEDKFSRLIGMQPIARPSSDLTIVFDVSASMYHEMEILQDEAKALASMVEVDYLVLQPFCDPSTGPMYRSRSSAEFAEKIDQIQAGMYGTGGQNSREMSFSGIWAALNVSKATSQIFTFTDEAPKDFEHFHKLAVLGMEKLYQFNFLITQPNFVDISLYQNLADLTGGKVLFMKRYGSSQMVQYLSRTEMTTRPFRERFDVEITLGTLANKTNSTKFTPIRGRPIVGNDYAVSVTFPNSVIGKTISHIMILTKKGEQLEILSPIQSGKLTHKFLFPTFKAPELDFSILAGGRGLSFRRTGLFKPVYIEMEDISEGQQNLFYNESLQFSFKITNHHYRSFDLHAQAFETSGDVLLKVSQNYLSIAGYDNVELVVTATVKTLLTTPKTIVLYTVVSSSTIEFNYVAKSINLLPAKGSFDFTPPQIKVENQMEDVLCDSVWSFQLQVSDDISGVSSINCGIDSVNVLASDLVGNSNMKTVTIHQ